MSRLVPLDRDRNVIAFFAFKRSVLPAHRYLDPCWPFGVLAVKEFTDTVALAPRGKPGVSIQATDRFHAWQELSL